MRTTLLWISLAVLALAGCRVDEAEELAPSQVKGMGSDALVVEGTVRVFPFDETEALATTKTDLNGLYEIDEFIGPAGLYRIRLEGGYYVEEASGTRIDLEDGDFLEALVFHQPGQPINTALTPLTTLASGMAQCAIDNGRPRVPAVRDSSSELSQIYDVNIHETYPANITDPESANFDLTTELQYGYVQAGRSELVKHINELNGHSGHDQYASIDLSRIAYNDVRFDCVLDGVGKESEEDTFRQLNMGSYKVTGDTYRSEHARAIIRAAAASYNKAGIQPTKLVNSSRTLALSTEKVFGNRTGSEFDSEGPVIAWTTKPNTILNSIATVEVSVEDFVGVNTASLYVNNTYYAELEELSDITLDIETQMFPDGLTTLTLEAVDNVGNVSTKDLTVTIDNTGPAINVTSSTLSNSERFLLEGSVSDTYNDIKSVTVNGQEADIEGNYWSLDVITAEDINTYEITATDSVGESNTVSIDVRIDTDAPSLNTFSSEGRFLDLNSGTERYLSLQHGLQDYALVMREDTYVLGNLQLNRTSMNTAGIPYFAFDATDGQAASSTPEEELDVEYRVLLSGGVIREWSNLPKVDGQYLLPLTLEYLSDYLLLAKKDDPVEIQVVVTDEATNTTEFAWNTSVDMALRKISYQLDDLEANQLFGYRYIGGTGGMLNYCTVIEGLCVITFATDAEDVQSIMDSARYVEPFNDEAVSSTSRIMGYTAFQGGDVQQYLSPLSSVFAGMFEAQYNKLADFNAAYSEARRLVESDLGFNPMETGIVDPQSAARLIPEVQHGMMLEALSRAAFDIEGRFTNTTNSISMAWASYRDLRDGMADGTENGITTKVGDAQFSHRDVVSSLGRQLVPMAEEYDLPYIDEVVEYSKQVFTPIIPTVDVNVEVENYANELTVTPIVNADSEVVYQLQVNGQTVGGDAASWTINTKQFPDGQAQLLVTVTDRWGQEATDSVQVIFDNTAPEIDLTSTQITTARRIPVQAAVVDNFSEPLTISVNGVEVDHLEDAIDHSIDMSADYTPLTIEVADRLGNTRTQEYSLIRIDELDGTSKARLVQLLGQAGGASPVPSIDVEVEGSLVEHSYNGTPIELDTLELVDGVNTVNFTVTNQYDDIDTLAINLLVDNTPAEIQLVSDQIVQKDAYLLQASVTDEHHDITEVYVNGTEVTLTDGMISLPSVLTRDYTQFLIETVDELGNESEQDLAVVRVNGIDSTSFNKVVQILEAAPSNVLVPELTLSVGSTSMEYPGSGAEWNVDTNEFTDGEYAITLTLNDLYGNTDTEVVSSIFDNTAPVIAQVSRHLVDTASLKSQFEVIDETLEVATVTVNGNDTTLDAETSIYSHTLSLPAGFTEVTVNAEDELGNASEAFYTVARLTKLPADYTGSFDLIGQDPNGNTLVALVNETEIALDGSQYRIDTSAFPDGLNAVTVNYTNESGQTNTLSYSDYVFDNNAPVLAETSKHITTANTFKVDFNAVDAGSEVVSLLINGQAATRSGDQYTRTLTLSPGYNEVEVIATDRLGLVNNSVFTVARVTDIPRAVNKTFTMMPATPAGHETSADVGGITELASSGDTLVVNTTEYTDGIKPVTVSYTNESGRTDSLELGSYTFDNTAPVIAQVSRHLVDTASLNSQFEVIDGTLEVATVTVNGSATSLNAETSVYSRTLSLPAGFTEVTVNAEDELGNASEASFTVARLNQLPGDYTGSFDLIGQDPHGNTLQARVNDTVIALDGSQYTIDTSGFPDGLNEVTVDYTNESGQTNTLNYSDYVFDNNAPVLSETSKHITTANTYTVDYNAVDAGSEVVSLLINGQAATRSGDQYTRTLTLSPGYNEVVVTATDRLGLVNNSVFTVARVTDIPRAVNKTFTMMPATPNGHETYADVGGTTELASSGNSLVVDTAEYTDGNKPVTLSYINESGRTDSLELGSYTFDNTAPVIAQVSRHLVDTANLVSQFEVTDATLTVADVTINDGSTAVDAGSSVYSRTLSLNPGYNGVVVRAEDELGNASEAYFTFARFNALPGDYTGEFDLIGQAPNGNEMIATVNSTGIALDGTKYVVDTSQFDDGLNALELSFTNESGQANTLTYSDYVFDNNAPVITESSQHITSASTFTVDFNAIDSGSEVVSFQIEGQDANRNGDQFSRSVALDPGYNTISVRAVDRLGLVRTHDFTVARVTESARAVKGSFAVLPKTPSGQDVVASVGENTVAAPSGQSLNIATTSFNDGATPVTVSYTNQSGRTDTLNLGTYTFDNTAPTIAELSDHLITASSLEAQFRVQDATMDVATVQVNGQTITGDSDVYSLVMAMASGFNIITVSTSDTLGNSRTERFDVARLTTLGGDYDGVYNLIDTPDQGVMTVRVDGTLIDDSGSAFAIDTTKFSDGANSVTVDYTNASGRKDSLSIAGVIFDNNAPVIAEASTHLTTASQLMIAADVTDAGTEVTSVTIDGLSTARSGDRFERQFNLSPGYNRFLVQATDRTGKTRSQYLTIARIQSTAGMYKGTMELLGNTPSSMLTEATIGGSLFQANAGDSLDINTAAMQDGSYNISVSFTNETDTTDTLDLGTYVFDNTAPVIEELSDHLLTSTAATLQYSVTDATVGVQQVDIEGLTTNSATSTYNQAITLSGGNNIVTVEATDEVGNVATQDFLVVVLETLPGNYDGSISLARTVPSGNSLRVFVDNAEVGPDGSSYVVDTTSYSDGTYPVRFELVNASGRKDSVSFSNYVFDNYAPELAEVSQHIVTGSSHTVRIEAVDGGSSIDRVTINGSNATFDGTNYNRTVTLAADFTDIVVSAWDKMGKRRDLDFSIARISDLAGAYNGTIRMLNNIPTGTNAAVFVNGTAISAVSGQDIDVNTNVFGDGTKTLEARFTNETGRTDSITLGQYLFDNTAPSVDLTSQILVTSSEYTLNANIVDQYSDLASLSVGGSLQSTSGKSKSVSKNFGLSSDVTVIPVTATDSLGNSTTENVNIVRFDSLFGGLFGGELELFDAIPVSGSGVNVDVAIDGVSLANPGGGNPWKISTQDYSDGIKDLQVTVGDSHGNSHSIKDAIAFDNTSPMVTFTSPALVDNSTYTLTMDAFDPGNGSGVKSVIIDGSNSGYTQVGNTYSKTLEITAATREFDVQVSDYAGNVTTTSYTVAKDVIDPTLQIAHSNARIWNPVTQSVEYVSDIDVARQNGFKLHHFYNEGNLGVVTNESPVDSGLDQHWVKLSVLDEGSATSFFSNLKNLDVDYRYTIGGLEIKNWTPATKRMDDEYYVTLGTEMLSNSFQLSRQDLTHKLEFRVTDEVGRTQIRSIEFGVVVQVDETSASRSASTVAFDWSQFSLETIQDGIGGKTISDIEGSYTNDTGKDVWLAVEKNIVATDERDISEVNFRNTGFWTYTTQWQYRCYIYDNVCAWQNLGNGTYTVAVNSTSQYSFTATNGTSTGSDHGVDSKSLPTNGTHEDTRGPHYVAPAGAYTPACGSLQNPLFTYNGISGNGINQSTSTCVYGGEKPVYYGKLVTKQWTSTGFGEEYRSANAINNINGVINVVGATNMKSGTTHDLYLVKSGDTVSIERKFTFDGFTVNYSVISQPNKWLAEDRSVRLSTSDSVKVIVDQGVAEADDILKQPSSTLSFGGLDDSVAY